MSGQRAITPQQAEKVDLAALRDLPKVGEPTAIVIFGASGDLTHRKLIPALYNLTVQSLLDGRSQIVGVARSAKTDEQFRGEMETAVKEHARYDFDPQVWEPFSRRIHYVAGSFDDNAAFARLAEKLKNLGRKGGATRNRLFYLATPPKAFGPIVDRLEAAGLATQSTEEGFARIIVEKPFGHDEASAEQLNREIGTAFDESQIFRIDHYLGKETVQNVLVFRLGNGIFEPLWNRRYVDHVQITAAEAIGVEGRAGYFDVAGVTRDMLQSHLLQLMTLIAMEPPVAFEPQSVHDEKVKVLRSIVAQSDDELRRHSVRGQYAAGSVAGQPVRGYTEEEGIGKGSTTETYVAVRLELDNWRWAGVPFYLRTGKRLPKRATEVAIVFKQPPFALFAHSGIPRVESNVLAIRIQPDEGISLRFASKIPGYDFHIDPVQMDFMYSRAFGIEPPEAYERLLMDAILGDSTLFARIDEVMLGWRFVDRLRAAWESDGAPVPARYEAGTWGPKESDELMARYGRKWRRL
jgi:glucose-6-phosphate 1-dehydrogenase